jgi:cell wall-associated NlpC family hydrolase
LVATAIRYALLQLGKPYLWGGTGPAGYDCSGLVMKAYQAAGISLPRTTFQQVNAGTPVYSTSQLEPGDLIFTPGSDGTPRQPRPRRHVHRRKPRHRSTQNRQAHHAHPPPRLLDN